MNYCNIVLVILSCTFHTLVQSQNCTRTGQCRCLMSDGSGEINLNSIGSTDGGPRWTIDHNGTPWAFSYNPCVGFNTAKYTNLAVWQNSTINPGEEYDLGVQSKEVFSTDEQGNLKIAYTSADGIRSSGVQLICEPGPGITEHHLQYLGELVTAEYEFILTSPCACAGACDSNGIIQSSTTPGTTTKDPNFKLQTMPFVINKSTTTPETTTKDPNAPSGGGSSISYWSQVGADIVSLILHDFILVVVIAAVLILLKLVFNYTFACCFKQEPQVHYKSQSNA